MKVLIDLTSLADNFSGIERFALSITKELISDQSRSDIEYILVFKNEICLLYTSPSPRDTERSRMPSSA